MRQRIARVLSALASAGTVAVLGISPVACGSSNVVGPRTFDTALYVRSDTDATTAYAPRIISSTTEKPGNAGQKTGDFRGTSCVQPRSACPPSAVFRCVIMRNSITFGDVIYRETLVFLRRRALRAGRLGADPTKLCVRGP